MGEVEFNIREIEGKQVQVGDCISFTKGNRYPEWEVISLETAIKHQGNPNYPHFWSDSNNAIVIQLRDDGTRYEGTRSVSWMVRDEYTTYLYTPRISFELMEPSYAID